MMRLSIGILTKIELATSALTLQLTLTKLSCDGKKNLSKTILLEKNALMEKIHADGKRATKTTSKGANGEAQILIHITHHLF